jgi:hypothetical protein
MLLGEELMVPSDGLVPPPPQAHKLVINKAFAAHKIIWLFVGAVMRSLLLI